MRGPVAPRIGLPRPPALGHHRWAPSAARGRTVSTSRGPPFMSIHDVWRPLTVATILGAGVLLPQAVAAAATPAANTTSCTTTDLLAAQGLSCTITRDADGRTIFSVQQTSPPTGTRTPVAGARATASVSWTGGDASGTADEESQQSADAGSDGRSGRRHSGKHHSHDHDSTSDNASDDSSDDSSGGSSSGGSSSGGSSSGGSSSGGSSSGSSSSGGSSSGGSSSGSSGSGTS